MLKNRGLKKVIKKFPGCTRKEERWLQQMLDKGWMLKKYDIEDNGNCQYIFEPVKNDKQKNLLYKMDCRQFQRMADYKRYLAILERAGWTPLATNKQFSKHVFYSESTNSHNEIFAHLNICRRRKKLAMSSSHIPTYVTLIASLVVIVIYAAFDNPALWNLLPFTS